MSRIPGAVIGHYVNEWFVLADGLVVHASTMAGCPAGQGELVLSLWEPSNLFGPHHTVTTMDDGQPGPGGRPVWLGRYTTRRPPADIEALPPMTDERAQAVRGWYDTRRAEAVAAIRRAMPEVAADERAQAVDGEVRICGPEWA